jgi:hypothetical protein
MCATCAVIENWTNPNVPGYMPWPPGPSPATALEMLGVLQRLEAIDKRLGQIECKMERKAKKKFKDKLRRRATRSARRDGVTQE